MKMKSIFIILLCILLAVAVSYIAPANFLNSKLLKAILVVAPFLALLFLLNRGRDKNESNNVELDFDPRLLSMLLWAA